MPSRYCLRSVRSCVFSPSSVWRSLSRANLSNSTLLKRFQKFSKDVYSCIAYKQRCYFTEYSDLFFLSFHLLNGRVALQGDLVLLHGKEYVCNVIHLVVVLVDHNGTLCIKLLLDDLQLILVLLLQLPKPWLLKAIEYCSSASTRSLASDLITASFRSTTRSNSVSTVFKLMFKPLRRTLASLTGSLEYRVTLGLQPTVSRYTRHTFAFGLEVAQICSRSGGGVNLPSVWRWSKFALGLEEEDSLSGFNLTATQFAECWSEHIRENTKYAELRLSNVSSVTLDAVVDILENTSEHVLNVSLILERDGISYLAPFAFHNLTRLETLSLRFNNLSRIANRTFAKLSRLRALKLSYNRIFAIEAGAFFDFKTIGYMHLGDNEITEIGEDGLGSFPNLAMFSLRGNPWRCDCELRWLADILIQRPDLTDNSPICATPEQLRNMTLDQVNFTRSCGPDTLESTTAVSILENISTPINDIMPPQSLVMYVVGVIGAGLFLIGVAATCMWRRWFLDRCCRHRERLQPLYRVAKHLALNQNYYSPHKSATNRLGGGRVTYTSNNKARLDNYEYDAKDVDEDNLKILDIKNNEEAGELALILDMGGHRGYGKVRLDRPLGFGHFGSVRLGHAILSRHSRRVAVKRIVHGAPTIVMELANGGDLEEYLRHLRPEVSAQIAGLEAPHRREYLQRKQPILYIFMLHVARGMKHLAKLKIVHRDLAARNILICEGQVAKISDFGLSRDIYGKENYRRQTDRPLPFRSLGPESLSSGTFTSKSDVWAFGVLLWEVTSLGERPYEHALAAAPPGVQVHEHLRSLLMSGYRLEWPNLCPVELEEIMKACWALEPADRPDFSCLANRLQHFINTHQQMTSRHITPHTHNDL
ncbi:ROS-like protein [Mya arenaria]|uniref:ROS-like protein n=1 Tax=Mya arenaria TaxID=6604 RepID=A0ABY7E4C6_MYAAR|nr:ROS-like protein [Mya arenaria]